MLSFTSEQWRELQAERNDQLKLAIADDLTLKYPNDKISRDELVGELDSVLHNAQELGIKSAELLYLHAFISKALGIDYFSVIPFVGQVLSDSNHDESFKLLWLGKWFEAVKDSLKNIHGA